MSKLFRRYFIGF